MSWTLFEDRLPTVGDRIEIKLDNGKLFGEVGTLTAVQLVGSGFACSLTSDSYVSLAVAGNYMWRQTEPTKKKGTK